MLAFFNKVIKRIAPNRRSMWLRELYPQYQIGRGTYGSTLIIYDWGEGATLRIGAFCSIALNVKILLGGEHRSDWVTTYPFNVLWEAGKEFNGHPRTKGDVHIGNDVWVGTEAVIMSGINIGDGAVLGARTVVARDIPPYAVAVGNPARIIKKRFDDKTIQRLLKVKWWNWEDDRIQKALPLLLNPDLRSFLQAAEMNEI